MNKNDAVWILVADAQHARLLHGTRTAHDRLHLEEVAATKSTFVVGEHQRSTSTGTGRGMGDVGHEHSEKLAHFARQSSAWLAKEIAARRIPECHVFAPSHLLGRLQMEVAGNVAGILREHAAELAQLNLAELTRHPRIAELMTH